MKSAVLTNIKLSRLQRRLKLRKWEAVGVLEMLWQVTAMNAPAGDIGKFSDEDIAVQLDWAGDERELVTALIESGWIDRNDDHRLVVHDWADHAPNWIRASLKRHGRDFAAPGSMEAPQPSQGGSCGGSQEASYVEPPQIGQGGSSGRSEHSQEGSHGLPTPTPTPTPNPPPTPPSDAASGEEGIFLDAGPAAPRIAIPDGWDAPTVNAAARKWLERRPAYRGDDLAEAFGEHATAADFAAAVNRSLGRGWAGIVPLSEPEQDPAANDERRELWRDIDGDEWNRGKAFKAFRDHFGRAPENDDELRAWNAEAPA